MEPSKASSSCNLSLLSPYLQSNGDLGDLGRYEPKLIALVWPTLKWLLRGKPGISPYETQTRKAILTHLAQCRKDSQDGKTAPLVPATFSQILWKKGETQIKLRGSFSGELLEAIAQWVNKENPSVVRAADQNPPNHLAAKIREIQSEPHQTEISLRGRFYPAELLEISKRLNKEKGIDASSS